MGAIEDKYKEDQRIWNNCSGTYEKQIVGGHPDIFAFECFEESFLDCILRHVSGRQSKPIKLMDIGCGSGRLHIRYGVKTADPALYPEIHTRAQVAKRNQEYMYDPILAGSLVEVWGIDFSSSMIDLARVGIDDIGLSDTNHIKLTIEEGSAFELEPEPAECIPVLVCLVNSIGVMQGPAGAVALFQSMKRAVEQSGGIAIISCYQKEYLGTYGLNQYESTMDVSGQPVWLVPDTYASGDYLKQPKGYKRAHSNDPNISVRICDRGGELILHDFAMRRSPGMTRETLKSGHIKTHSGYESNWYSFRQIEEWVRTYWGDLAYHFKTVHLDAIRAEPAQVAILDCSGCLGDLLVRWDLPYLPVGSGFTEEKS